MTGVGVCVLQDVKGVPQRYATQRHQLITPCNSCHDLMAHSENQGRGVCEQIHLSYNLMHIGTSSQHSCIAHIGGLQVSWLDIVLQLGKLHACMNAA